MAAEAEHAPIIFRAIVPGVPMVQGAQGARGNLIVEAAEEEAMEARAASVEASAVVLAPMAMRIMAGTVGMSRKVVVIMAMEARGMAVVVVVVEVMMETYRSLKGLVVGVAEVQVVRPRFRFGYWGVLGDMGLDRLVAKEGIILPIPGHAMDAMADIMSPVQMAIIPLMLASTWEVEVEAVGCWIEGEEPPEAVVPAVALWP
jgi:hypothetical protein